MPVSDPTVRRPPDAREVPRPGLLVVFSGTVPACRTLELQSGAVELNRAVLYEKELDDPSVSRVHARLSVGTQRWTIEDVGSTNGTFVDGARVEPSKKVTVEAPHVLRFGDTVALPVADARPYAQGGVSSNQGIVQGPATTDAFLKAWACGSGKEDLLILGETGTGKELAAKKFWLATSTSQFVPVNCATLTERLVDGPDHMLDRLIRSAEGGVLFLDEVGELHKDVQAKLLRLFETRQHLFAGEATTRTLNLRICLATHLDLREKVAAGGFRNDLYHRISKQVVTLLPLRERPEEIPWLIATALASTGEPLVPTGAFVEACLLRHWPGNVRELLAETQEAARKAGLALRNTVEAEDLDPQAGVQPGRHRQWPSKGEVNRALLDAKGNVSEAARKLDLHRNQLYRLMERYGLKDPGGGEDESA